MKNLKLIASIIVNLFTILNLRTQLFFKRGILFPLRA